MEVEQIIVQGENITPDALFTSERIGIQERRQARRASLSNRVQAAANLANATDEPFICWCDLNAESDALTAAIDGAVEVRGSQSPQEKAGAYPVVHRRSQSRSGIEAERRRVRLEHAALCADGLRRTLGQL